MIGTFAYMAPERFTTGQTDARSDVYALACVLFECLTGEQPYSGDSLEQQIAAHLTSQPPRVSVHRPEIPAGLDDVIARGMAKNPDDRYPTAGDLAADAQHALTASAHKSRSDSAATVVNGRLRADFSSSSARATPPRSPHRTRSVLLFSAAAALAGAAILGYLVIGRDSAPRSSDPAKQSSVTLTIASTTESPLPPTPAPTPTPAPPALIQPTTVRIQPTTLQSPYVIECLEGTPGPALWSDGTTRYSEECYQQNGGPAYSTAESAAGPVRNTMPCVVLGQIARDTVTGQRVKCTTNPYYTSPTWLAMD
jgi:serine/threonine protein kinase